MSRKQTKNRRIKMDTMNKETLEALSIDDLAVRFRDLRDELKNRKDVSSMIQKEFDLVRKIVIPDKMENLGFDSVNITDVGRISLRAEMYASILAEKKQDAYEWLMENGHGELIKETVNASSLKALIKEQMNDGVVFPDDLFTINPYTMATLTKA